VVNARAALAQSVGKLWPKTPSKATHWLSLFLPDHAGQVIDAWYSPDVFLAAHA